LWDVSVCPKLIFISSLRLNVGFAFIMYSLPFWAENVREEEYQPELKDK
jgi:hypothetical protein